MKTNAAGIALIKESEGLKLKAYRDQVGVLTIGYGTTGSAVRDGMTITEAQANSMLADRLSNECEPGVSHLVTGSISANQFAALVDFAYNLGVAALGRSTLLKKLNAGDELGASDEFVKWCMAGGQECAGLLKRREAERDLFLTAD